MKYNNPQLTKIAFVIFLFVIRTDTQAQDVGSQFGKTDFDINQLVFHELGSNETDFENLLAHEFHLPGLSEVFEQDVSQTMEFGDSLELQRSENALRAFAYSVKDLELPFSFELNHSDLTLARWDKEFLGFETTKLMPKHDQFYFERPQSGHIKLVWTSTGFELQRFQTATWSVQRCWTPSPPPPAPAQRAEVIPLTVHSRGSGGANLVLVPKQSRLLPLFVILSDLGTARTALSSNTDILFPVSNLNKSSTTNKKYAALFTVVD